MACAARTDIYASDRLLIFNYVFHLAHVMQLSASTCTPPSRTVCLTALITKSKSPKMSQGAGNSKSEMKTPVCLYSPPLAISSSQFLVGSHNEQLFPSYLQTTSLLHATGEKCNQACTKTNLPSFRGSLFNCSKQASLTQRST